MTNASVGILKSLVDVGFVDVGRTHLIANLLRRRTDIYGASTSIRFWEAVSEGASVLSSAGIVLPQLITLSARAGMRNHQPTGFSFITRPAVKKVRQSAGTQISRISFIFP